MRRFIIYQSHSDCPSMSMIKNTFFQTNMKTKKRQIRRVRANHYKDTSSVQTSRRTHDSFKKILRKSRLSHSPNFNVVKPLIPFQICMILSFHDPNPDLLLPLTFEPSSFSCIRRPFNDNPVASVSHCPPWPSGCIIHLRILGISLYKPLAYYQCDHSSSLCMQIVDSALPKLLDIYPLCCKYLECKSSIDYVVIISILYEASSEVKLHSIGLSQSLSTFQRGKINHPGYRKKKRCHLHKGNGSLLRFCTSRNFRKQYNITENQTTTMEFNPVEKASQNDNCAT